MKKIIAPSILSANFAHLAKDVEMLNRSEAEWIHVDVMDGVFVPNLSFGFPVLEAIRPLTKKFMDVHLMIVEPERYVERFIKSGADQVTVHAEAVDDLRGALKRIRKLGAKSGVSIKPGTPIGAVAEVLDVTDLVLIMSVEPGFGGQSFMESSIDKVRELRELIDRGGHQTLIEIDGGIGADNAARLWSAGCNVLVAGSAIFKAQEPDKEIVKMLNA